MSNIKENSTSSMTSSDKSHLSEDISDKAYTLSPEDVLDAFQSTRHGLTQDEAAARLELYGSNRLPETKPASIAKVFLHQFKSPLIYVLVVAA